MAAIFYNKHLVIAYTFKTSITDNLHQAHFLGPDGVFCCTQVFLFLKVINKHFPAVLIRISILCKYPHKIFFF